jgi:hypothetical protein
LVGRPEGKRSLGRSRNGWENNIKVDLKWGWCGLDFWLRIGESPGFCEHGYELMNIRVP